MARTRAVSRPSIRLTLDDKEVGGSFRECSGLDSETEVTEQKAVDESGRPVMRKIAGLTRWSNITLRRGVDKDTSLWEWRTLVQREGSDAARTDGTIELLDYEGSPIATYRFTQGWPVRYGVVVGTAGDDSAVETVEICVESVTRV
jgi:phage tail-like protein